MRLDRYTKCVLTIIASALAALAAHAWLPHATLPAAEAQTMTPRYEITLPKAWGKIVSFSNGNFLMESTDGVMRIVDLDGKPPEYPKVKVQLRRE